MTDMERRLLLEALVYRERRIARLREVLAMYASTSRSMQHYAAQQALEEDDEWAVKENPD